MVSLKWAMVEVYIWSRQLMLGKTEQLKAAAMTVQQAERTAACDLQLTVSKPCALSIFKELTKYQVFQIAAFRKQRLKDILECFSQGKPENLSKPNIHLNF